MKSRTCTLLVLILLTGVLRAQEPITLMSPKDAWTFNNGAEFPGAAGSLTIDPATQGKDGISLKLVGDFTKGGMYVQAGRKIDKIDIRELSFWVRNPDGAKFTLRLNDGSGQTHQFAMKLETNPDWHQVVFPIEKFFARRGQADAVTTVSKYESWGGAKDGKWHGPATGIFLLLGSEAKKEVRTLWFREITVLTRPREVPGADLKTVIGLDEVIEGEHDWRFSIGAEFKGAKGSLSIIKDEPEKGKTSFKLAGDFTGGGAYVAAIKDLKELGVKDVPAFHLRVKTENASLLGVQLVDGTGQTHQTRIPITADGKWHDLSLIPSKVAGGEHWGGANDGKWHGPPTQLVFSATAKADQKGKQPVIHLAEIRAEGLIPVFVQPAAFKQDFEAGKLPENWKTEGGVTVDSKTAFKGSHSLLLSRSLEAVERPCSVISPTFAAAPGQWEIALACRAELSSPDNSYDAVVALECLDAQGKVVDRITLADVFGKRDWAAIAKRIEIAKGVSAARLQVQLNKTHGQFWIDEISAAYLAPASRRDDRIARMLFSTSALGNLLLPDASRQVNVTVETTKPLRDSQLALSYEVRDYWGAEQMKPATATLKRSDKKGPRISYEATLDLQPISLEIGRYYELHASIAQEGGEPFRNHTSFAILPEAEIKRYKPEEVPFTSRNWDNRFPQYFELSDRLGMRTCGVWGGWSSKPPYKPEAPQIELCEKLKMGILSGTPISTIERGKTDYDETALRQGVRNWLEKYGKYRPLTINLGNEPHGTGERVKNNVAAYRAVYEEIKKFDPTVFVLATAVEPNEEYFKLEYGKYCDAYDFHVYEGFNNVRRNIEQYKALMKKYGNEKPIWSTELGLNSQGLPRHVVASELTKTFTTFFASGGVNASWFALLYPDPDAKSHGSSGDSHNVFDCRYNRYAPRLDAVAYYNAVQAIAIKKFKEEKQYPEGISAFLFRDREKRNLQVLWRSKGRQDVFVPLTGAGKVLAIHVDGSRRELDAGGKGITTTVSEDPLILLYEREQTALPDALGAPVISLQSPPASASRRGPTTLTIQLAGDSAKNLEVIAPPFWTVTRGDEAATITRFNLTPPQNSSVREARIFVKFDDGKSNRPGELYYRLPVSE